MTDALLKKGGFIVSKPRVPSDKDTLLPSSQWGKSYLSPAKIFFLTLNSNFTDNINFACKAN